MFNYKEKRKHLEWNKIFIAGGPKNVPNICARYAAE